MWFESVEEVHPYHHQTSHIKNVENQFGPRFAQTEIDNCIEHYSDRKHPSHCGNDDVEYLSVFLESCLHRLFKVFSCVFIGCFCKGKYFSLNLQILKWNFLSTDFWDFKECCSYSPMSP